MGRSKLMPEKEIYPIRNCAGCGDPIFLDKGNYIQFVSTSQIKWYTHKDCFTKSLNKGLSDWLEIEMNSYFRKDGGTLSLSFSFFLIDFSKKWG